MAITVLQVCNAQRNNVKFFTQIMLPYIRVFSSDCQQALVQSCWDRQCLVLNLQHGILGAGYWCFSDCFKYLTSEKFYIWKDEK